MGMIEVKVITVVAGVVGIGSTTIARHLQFSQKGGIGV